MELEAFELAGERRLVAAFERALLLEFFEERVLLELAFELAFFFCDLACGM